MNDVLRQRLAEAKARTARQGATRRYGRGVADTGGELSDLFTKPPRELREDRLTTPAEPHWRQKLADLISGTISYGPADALDKRIAARLTGTHLPGTPEDEPGIGGLDLLPFTGAGMALGDAKTAAEQGDWKGAALDLAGVLVPGAGKARKVAKGGGKALKAAEEIAAPAVHTRGTEPAAEKIFQHAEEVRSPKYEMAKEPVFGPADPELTKKLVPQKSIAAQLPPMPDAAKALPANDRARQILENKEAIGTLLAEDLSKVPGKPLPFYSTGSVLEGLKDRAGLTGDQAYQHLSDWAGQGAATSPRTATPQNLRNSSYLLYRRAQGNPLTPEVQKAEQASGLYGFDKKGKPNMNRPGFAMMGMHTKLGDEFARGEVDLWKNPKPGTFKENWTGNMADVTGDTHNIRKILDAYDRLFPGSLDKGWFTSDEAYQAYKARGGFDPSGELPVGDISDTLEGAMIPGTGRYAQTEYPILQGPTIEAAKQLGISPAEAQERLWFEGGPRTGLRSPPMTIPDLFNAQIEQTAKVLGVTPEEVMKIWARRGIPLASNEPTSDVPGASAVG